MGAARTRSLPGSTLRGDQPHEDVMISYETGTLLDALNAAAGRGFTEHFTVTRGRLRAGQSGVLFDPGQVTICGYERFEGVSDPDDMSILYTIRTRSGVRGTLTDAYGTY